MSGKIDDLRILDDLSGVTVGCDVVLYPSEERLAADLAEIGYDMPTEGMYTVEQYMGRIGLHGDKSASLWMPAARMVDIALGLMEQGAQWPEVDGPTLRALRERLAHRIAEAFIS